MGRTTSSVDLLFYFCIWHPLSRNLLLIAHRGCKLYFFLHPHRTARIDAKEDCGHPGLNMFRQTHETLTKLTETSRPFIARQTNITAHAHHRRGSGNARGCGGEDSKRDSSTQAKELQLFPVVLPSGPPPPESLTPMQQPAAEPIFSVGTTSQETSLPLGLV